MEYRRFGRTGLEVSVMGLGTGGPSQLGQGSGVPEAEAVRTVRRALELGVNLIDTAADYAESEAILGRALANAPRDSYVLCTKFNGVRNHRAPAAGPEALKDAAEMAESLERSLRRLGTDHVDLLQLHGVTPDWYDRVQDRFLPALRRLRQQGKTRFLGITERFTDDPAHESLTRALADGSYDAMMVGYNLLSPSAEEHVLPEARRRGVGVLIMFAVRRTLARPELLEQLVAQLKASGELAADALPDRGPLDRLLQGDVDSVPSAAYRFAAGHPGTSCVLSGTARVDHLEQNVAAIQRGPLPAADREWVIRTFGPLRRSLGN